LHDSETQTVERLSLVSFEILVACGIAVAYASYAAITVNDEGHKVVSVGTVTKAFFMLEILFLAL
jgi:hypothetical protein